MIEETKNIDDLMKNWKELHGMQALLYKLIDQLQSEKDELTSKIKKFEEQKKQGAKA